MDTAAAAPQPPGDPGHTRPAAGGRRAALAGLAALGLGGVITRYGGSAPHPAQAQEGGEPPAARVLVLLDGAARVQTPGAGAQPDYGYTGDWVPRLQQTGYDVVARDPGSLPGGGLRLEDFALVVLGFPATLPATVLDEVVRAAQQSRVPVLVASPAYAAPLGLGRIWDPTNPNRTVYGTTVELTPQAAALTGGLEGTVELAGGPGLEDVPYTHTLYRTPIRPEGTVLGWIADEAGERRAVWSLGPDGTRLYFGVWWSADGRNHNATYWRLFDGSVRALVAAGQGHPPATPMPTAAPDVPLPTPTLPSLKLPRTGGASVAPAGAEATGVLSDTGP